MPVKLKRRLLTVDEYHLMGEVGILRESGTELIKGEIIERSPIGSKHAAIVEKVKDLLILRLRQKAQVRVQNPIVLGTHSEPEPDIAIVKYRSDYYLEQHPGGQDTLLIIEVSDSSKAYDREIKLPLYAESGIPEVWIIDLVDEQVEVYHSPKKNSYEFSEILKRNAQISPREFEFSIAVERIFH